MSDVTVARWRQIGSVYLWRYTEDSKDYPGWQMTADVPACRSLVDLLSLMLNGRYSSNQLIRVSPPTREVLLVPNFRGGRARWHTVRSWRLRYPKAQVAPDHWELVETSDQVQLILGEQRLKELREGLQWIMAGGGICSYGVGPASDESLSLWW